MNHMLRQYHRRCPLAFQVIVRNWNKQSHRILYMGYEAYLSMIVHPPST